MSILTVKNVSFSYSANQVKTVDNVSFQIEKGSYTALVGTNGSGKSTLSKIICGLLQQSEGQIEIAENTRIGLVFQSPKDQLVSSVVSRDTAFGPQNLGLKPDEVELRTIECLNVVDLLEKAGSSTSALSLGQTQKTALSGMLAIWPELLILDEAVAMIDPETRQSIFEFLRYWHKKGNTIIHITHDMDAIKEAEKILVMEKGALIFNGSLDDFMKNAQLVSKIKGPEIPVSNKKNFAVKNPDSEKNPDFPVNPTKKTLEFSDVFFKYSSSDEKYALEKINFSLYKGQLVALTGASGAGKSTIMELASGLLKPESGKISAVSKPALAQQNCSAALFEAFAADDVAFGPINKGIKGKELKNIVISSMNEVNLPYEEFGERQTFCLSGGEQRRLAIAGILAMDRDIVFFDEPSAGLDGKSRYEVLQMMRRLADEGKTVMFSTHKIDEAAFADREIHIEKGKIISGSQISEDKENNLPQLLPYDFEKTISSLRNASLAMSGAKRKKSAVEKLAPALRIILFLILFIASLAVQPLYLCLIQFALSLLYCKIAGFSLKKLLIAALKILPFLLFFSIFQLIFHQPVAGEIHYTNWKWFCITPSKLIFCLETIIRTDASLACLSAFFVSTPEYDLIDGLKLLLKPLSLIKIPVRYFILIIEIIFRFIPLLIDEAGSIIKTQVIRGGFGKVKGKMAKIKALIPMIVPLILQTIKRSEALADAITMRCFK